MIQKRFNSSKITNIIKNYLHISKKCSNFGLRLDWVNSPEITFARLCELQVFLMTKPK